MQIENNPEEATTLKRRRFVMPKLELSKFEKKLEIRNITELDLDGILDLQQLCFPGMDLRCVSRIIYNATHVFY